MKAKVHTVLKENMGGRQSGNSDCLSESILQDIRKTEWIGEKTVYFPKLDSTNTKAKQLAEEGYPSGTLVVAEQQDAGRGRRGRGWESPQGAGIFMTVMLKPDIEPNNASMLTLVAA